MFFLSGILGLFLASVSFLTPEEAGADDANGASDPDSMGAENVSTDAEPTGDLLTDDTGGDVTEPTDQTGTTDTPTDQPTDLPDDLFDSDSDLTDSEWSGMNGDDTDETLTGTDDGQQVGGEGGNDTIYGGAGNDELLGQDGDDVVFGAEGNDSLIGEDGNDQLSGGDGADTITGGMGDDTLAGDAGDDDLSGGAGDDFLGGGVGNDSLMGNDGNDTLTGGLGADELLGGKGDDVLNGIVPDDTGTHDIDEKDFLNGGEGADTLFMGNDDWANGGDGADVFVLGSWIDAAHGATIEDYDPAEDHIAVVYDPSTATDPMVGIEPSETADAVWVTLNGARIAEVLNAPDLTPEDVKLYTPDQMEFAA